MHINRIYVDQVALARSLAASITTRQDVLARLPEWPLHRERPTGRNPLSRLIGRLRNRPSSTRGNIETQVRTKHRERAGCAAFVRLAR